MPAGDTMRRAAALAAALPNGAPVAVVTDGAAAIVATDPVDVVVAPGTALTAAIRTVIARGGFWAGWITYDAGRAIEAVRTRTVDDRGLPDVAFVRFESATELRPGAPPARRRGTRGRVLTATAAPAAPVALGPMHSSLTRRQHAERVDAVHALLRAGDCYQVNVTRRLHSPTRADARALLAALAATNPAPHTALVTVGGVTVVSASPERFVRIDGDHVETAPIKGTATDARALTTSAKDAAEHVMIVDLARNDLGRVARPGSVRVAELAAVEPHPGLHHLVSRVHAERRPGTDVADVLRALLPPASVTGAPKPRVLQAIEDLEPVRRGVYCGAVGWIDATGATDGAVRADLAVAIRTFTISETGTDLGVGGGIVIDSDADAEWAETELKARRLLRAAGAFEAAPVAMRSRA